MDEDHELPSAVDVEFLKDGQHGDSFRYRLRIRFFDSTADPPSEVQRIFPWDITGSEIAEAEHAGRSHVQLETEKLERYRYSFARRVQTEMRLSKTRLSREGGRLVRRRAAG